MEELVHTWGQWAVLIGALLKAVTEKVNMSRDIKDLEKDLKREQDNSAEMQRDIHDIKESMAALKVART